MRKTAWLEGICKNCGKSWKRKTPYANKELNELCKECIEDKAKYAFDDQDRLVEVRGETILKEKIRKQEGHDDDIRRRIQEVKKQG